MQSININMNAFVLSLLELLQDFKRGTISLTQYIYHLHKVSFRVHMPRHQSGLWLESHHQAQERNLKHKCTYKGKIKTKIKIMKRKKETENM